MTRRLAAFAAVLATLAVATLAQEPNDAVGEARDDLPHILREMCELSSSWFFGRMKEQHASLYRIWAEEVRELPRSGPRFNRVLHYFYSRPADTRSNSMCAPMNTTCCRQHTEKHIVRISIKEYSALFLNVTQENIGSCFTVGRKFYHAVYSNFLEVRRQLEIPVRNLLDGKLPADLFDDFFVYLSSFLVSSDLCDLPLQLNSVMSKIFDFIYDAQPGESMRETHTECYGNFSTHIMSDIYERLFPRLERQVYNLDLIFRAMQMSELVIEELLDHRFSSVCTKPLTQLQNCGKCSGYSTFKPCLFYCMNILRGCFADIADVHKEFRLMTKALSDIPDDILGTFQPEVFIKESLIHFVSLVEGLRERNLKSEISSVCGSDGAALRRKRLSISRRQSTTVTTGTSPTQESDRLAVVFGTELQCMEKIVDLMGSVPEQMCYQSKEHATIADTGNHRCWMGTRMGAYYHREVRFNKEDQVNNPEFRYTSHPPYLDQYHELCMGISTLTAEINETLDLVLCLDDEDCTQAPFYLCGEDLVASGSGDLRTSPGSGSGSGSGYDDGMRDMEDGDQDGETNGTDVYPPPQVYHDQTNFTRPYSDETEKEDYTVLLDIPSGENITEPEVGSGSGNEDDPIVIEEIEVETVTESSIGGTSSSIQQVSITVSLLLALSTLLQV